ATTSYGIQIYADSFAYDADIVFQSGETIDNIVNGIVNVGGKLRVTENSDTITFSHTGTYAYAKWSAGTFIFQTDAGVNTNTYVDIKGKGTGTGNIRLFDQDDAEYMRMQVSNEYGIIEVKGTNPSGLHIQYTQPQSIYFWAGVSSGTPYFYIYGYDTGTSSVKYLRMNVSAGGHSYIVAEERLYLRAAGNLNLNDSAEGDIFCFVSATTGENRALIVYGYKNAIGPKYGKIWVDNGGDFRIDCQGAGYLQAQAGTTVVVWNDTYVNFYKDMRLSDDQVFKYGTGS
ncbi:unnamed protein product, partial [marine sediment metagenome]